MNIYIWMTRAYNTYLIVADNVREARVFLAVMYPDFVAEYGETEPDGVIPVEHGNTATWLCYDSGILGEGLEVE